jgi:cytochrome c oxidase assembly factor 4
MKPQCASFVFLFFCTKMHDADLKEEDKDEWELRIERTGCAKENERLQVCYLKNHDWRKCVEEMTKFKKCFAVYIKSKGG